MEQKYHGILDEFAESPDISERLKAELTESLPKEERDKLLIEIKFLEYDFRQGDLRPAREHISPEGKVTGYPDISDFTNEEWDYIKERATACKSLFLKARYTHLLYKKTPRNDLAGVAIGYYRDLCKFYLKNDPADDESLAIFCQCLECYLRLSMISKSDIANAKKEVLDYIRDKRIPFVWKDNLAEMILRYSQFKKKDLEGLTEFMMSSMPKEEASFSIKEIYLKTCLRLAKKEEIDNTDIYQLLGENEMKHGENQASEEMGIVTMHAYQQAAYYFKMAKNDLRQNEATVNLTQQKDKIGLKTARFELTPEQVDALNGEQNKIVDYLLSKDELLPYIYLVKNQDLLKEEAEMENGARESMKGTLYPFVNMQIYDINGNPRTLVTEEEKIAYFKSRDYSFHLQLYIVLLINKLFYAGIRKAKISAARTMTFFGHTWFARTLVGYKAKSDDETFTWLQIIGPALYNLLSQIEQSCLDKNFVPNYQLAIDSLSVKIEGMIRDLARHSNVPVTKIREHETEEMKLDDLLREKSITNLFESRDVYLWKFLFTRSGLNFRNDVAHAFFRPKDYTTTKAMLILLALFRMCKYENLLSGD